MRRAFAGALLVLATSCAPPSVPEPQPAAAEPSLTEAHAAECPAEACGADHAAATPTPSAPAAPGAPSEALYGQPFAQGVPEVTLSTLLADPSAYEGQLIETRGLVSSVCQARGCWMELQDGGSGERVRTPMAGHAFFLPRDVVGRQARVQGRVQLRLLTEEHKRHLEAEGAQATDTALSLSATAVAVK